MAAKKKEKKKSSKIRGRCAISSFFKIAIFLGQKKRKEGERVKSSSTKTLPVSFPPPKSSLCREPLKISLKLLPLPPLAGRQTKCVEASLNLGHMATDGLFPSN